MARYTISDVKTYEGDNMSDAKTVTLRVGGRKVDSLCKAVERTTDLKTLNGLGNGIINECYIDLTLDKLRELDDDTDAQTAYIKSRSRFLDSDNLRIMVIKLKLEKDQRLNDLDYGYLMSLLDWSNNDLPLMPLLEFGEGVETPIQLQIYQDFVNQILERRFNYGRLSDIAMSIPLYYPRRRLEMLFESYHDIKPTFVAMDLSNKRVDSIPDGKYSTIKEYLSRDGIDNTFLYGINVKPCKNGGSSVSALDVQSIHWSFNATGPTHHKPVKRVIVPNDWSNAGRVFDKGELQYTRFDDGNLGPFIEWVDGNYGFSFDVDYSKNERSTYSYLKRYNFINANRELMEVSESLRKGETEVVDHAFDRLPVGLRGK